MARGRTLDKLLRHLQPGVHGLVVPGHVRILEGSGVVVALDLARLVPKNAVEVRALLVRAAGLDRVALAAPARVRRLTAAPSTRVSVRAEDCS